MLNMFKSRKLNESDKNGLVYCIDNQIRVRLTKVNNKQTMVELFNGRVCDFNKIIPQDVTNKQQAELIMKCYDSFAKGNYATRNKRIEIER